VLDELATVRSALEGSMSAEVATRRSDDELAQLRAAFARMAETIDDDLAYQQADADFHTLVMTLSGNRLAENITNILFQRARASNRFVGDPDRAAYEQTLTEHGRVLDAIENGDAAAAESAMRTHIIDAWMRRRPPNAKHG
jgi:DNA-binding FadR family transcriptional regulator